VKSSVSMRDTEWSVLGSRDMDCIAAGEAASERERTSQWTRDNKLRQPVFLGLRDDKDPRKVVREGE
jgi:hypothetical protein